MRNIVFKKVALNGGWRSHNAVIMLKVDHVKHTVSFTQISDSNCRNVDFTALAVLILSDKDIRKEFRWVKNYKRTYPASVDLYEGVSGCREWTVNIHRKRGFEDVIWDKVASFYVSAGNCAGYFCSRDGRGGWDYGNGIFSGDLALIVDSWCMQPDVYNVICKRGMVKYLKFHKPAGPGKHTTRMWVDPYTGVLER